MTEDRFANWAGIEVVESAANTITFAELLTGVGFNTKKGMLIDQIDYFIPIAVPQLFVADADGVRFGITISTGVSALDDPTDGRTVHSGELFRKDYGTAAVAVFHRMPLVSQFFPSLITANIRLYLAVQGVSLASAATIRARIYWRGIDLTDREISELVQATLLQA